MLDVGSLIDEIDFESGISIGNSLSRSRQNRAGQPEGQGQTAPSAQRQGGDVDIDKNPRESILWAGSHGPNEQVSGVEPVRTAIQPWRRPGSIESNSGPGGVQTGLYEPTSVLRYSPVESAGSKESTALAYLDTASRIVRRERFARLPCEANPNASNDMGERRAAPPPEQQCGAEPTAPSKIVGQTELPLSDTGTSWLSSKDARHDPVFGFDPSATPATSWRVKFPNCAACWTCCRFPTK